MFHPGIASNHSDDQPYSWSLPPYHPPTERYKNAPVCLGMNGSGHANLFCPVDVTQQPGGSLPDIQIADKAIEFLGSRKTSSEEKPFFLAVGFHKPHIPLKFPAEYLNLHPIDSVRLADDGRMPAGMPHVAWNPWTDIRWREDIASSRPAWPWGPLSDDVARRVRQGYAAAVSYTDYQVRGHHYKTYPKERSYMAV